jgi:hypothetical protein
MSITVMTRTSLGVDGKDGKIPSISLEYILLYIADGRKLALPHNAKFCQNLVRHWPQLTAEQSHTKDLFKWSKLIKGFFCVYDYSCQNQR